MQSGAHKKKPQAGLFLNIFHLSVRNEMKCKACKENNLSATSSRAKVILPQHNAAVRSVLALRPLWSFASFEKTKLLAFF